ncbi:MAG: protein adenylyltransferase SelO family protein, partial [Gammaproteobacteria bacterium]
LEAVVERKAALVARWMGVGFIHGVMNTDNTSVSGETIDYGPCAFMDAYDPATVFSSIDRRGRYAYANQPGIAQWNLARLAETLLPLVDADPARAVERLTPAVQGFAGHFERHWLDGMRRKLGLAGAEADDAALARALLDAMQAAAADFTATFRRLAELAAGEGDAPEGLGNWTARWRARLARDPQAPAERAAAMRAVSPTVIPRNHHVEAALAAAVDEEDFAPFERLLAVLARPFEARPEAAPYLGPPVNIDPAYRTFCGT